jgi:hypothetical protein
MIAYASIAMALSPYPASTLKHKSVGKDVSHLATAVRTFDRQELVP